MSGKENPKLKLYYFCHCRLYWVLGIQLKINCWYGIHCFAQSFYFLSFFPNPSCRYPLQWYTFDTSPWIRSVNSIVIGVLMFFFRIISLEMWQFLQAANMPVGLAEHIRFLWKFNVTCYYIILAWSQELNVTPKHFTQPSHSEHFIQFQAIKMNKSMVAMRPFQ